MPSHAEDESRRKKDERHAGGRPESEQRRSLMNWEEQFHRRPESRSIDRLTLHEKNGVVWLSFPLLDQFDFIVNAFSTRIGGVSEGYASSMNLSLSREISGGYGHQAGIRTDLPEEDVWKDSGPLYGETDKGGFDIVTPMGRFLENHRRFSSAVGYDLHDLVFSDQTHTDHIREVTEKDRGNGMTRPNAYHDVDGLMTDSRRTALMTFYADCVPLLLADPVKKAVASVHSGWRGTIAGIGTKAVKRMQERYGSDPADICAAIGPSICQDCYEVSEDVADAFREKYAGEALSRIVRPGRPGHAQLNLQEACRENFLMAGLLPQHVSVPDLCTAENSGLLFSHRALKGRRGNLAAVIEIR